MWAPGKSVSVFFFLLIVLMYEGKYIFWGGVKNMKTGTAQRKKKHLKILEYN